MATGAASRHRSEDRDNEQVRHLDALLGGSSAVLTADFDGLIVDYTDRFKRVVL